MNPNMLLFLYGEDHWRKQQKLNQIVQKFVKEVDPSRLNLVILEAGAVEEEAFRAALRASPFLARKRLVVLKNFLTQSKRKAFSEILIELLPGLGEERIMVVSEDEGKPKTWTNQTVRAIWEKLEKQASCEEFKPFWGAKLESAIIAQGQAHGLALQKEAAEFLAVLSGGDLGQTEKEIEKLTNYCRNRKATVEDVKFLCTIEGETNIFEFLDALGAKDRKALLHTAQEQLKETEPLALVSRASGYLRALLAMKLAGVPGAQALKLHPFQAKKISAQLRHWDILVLKKFLFQLLALDYAVKRGLAADAKTQLTALLATISPP